MAHALRDPPVTTLTAVVVHRVVILPRTAIGCCS